MTTTAARPRTHHVTVSVGTRPTAEVRCSCGWHTETTKDKALPYGAAHLREA
ncbi:hypothetical protein [Jiangella gansuensis]|uniref:hypothetical protein n=1 Tax=Jiangella gansuensis TaxID=281473 RepID=UPI0004B295D3|nr:hypothetical protein [Jiangella gansuensis]